MAKKKAKKSPTKKGTSSKIQKPEKKQEKKNSKSTLNKKSSTTMKKTSNKKSEKKDLKTKKEVEKKQKKASTTTKPTSSKKEKEEKKKSNKRVTNKPKGKKDIDFEEEDELLEDEFENEDDLAEDESEDVTEVEDLDLSNIEPVIADVDILDEEEEEEEYVPKTRGRKKQAQPEVTHQQQTLEEIIRNRPLQIDPTKKVYVTKKEDEPKPYVASNKVNKTRYSDEELQEFKEIILQRLKETKENYDQLKKYFTNEDDNGIDDTSPTFKMIEDGSGVMTKEEIEQQLVRLEKYMIDLQNALLRIENKTYGICTVTGKLIPKERLRSVPHATKSIEAKISRDN